MIPYSRPNLSDLNTLSQSKLLENHTFKGVKPIPPAPRWVLILHNMQNNNAQVY